MDLSTSYLGFRLKNPVVASASPLSRTVEGVRQLADAGVGAVVLSSLFEEVLEAEARRHGALVEAGSERFAESLTYFPEAALADAAPRRYLSLIERASSAVAIPVIASLNAVTPAGWTTYARQMQDAGAVAIELNFLPSLPVEDEVSGRVIEERQLEALRLVKAVVSVPVAVKMNPCYSAAGEMARRFAAAGADGLVLFNRFLCPDIDPQALAVVPSGGLSSPADGRLPRAWIALLRRRLTISLAASSGVEGPDDVAKHLLAGSDVVMTASALLRHGPEYAQVLLGGLCAWMASKGFSRLEELRGLLAAEAR